MVCLYSSLCIPAQIQRSGPAPHSSEKRNDSKGAAAFTAQHAKVQCYHRNTAGNLFIKRTKGIVMIINIEQNRSNLSQRFEIYMDGSFAYEGNLGSLSRFQEIHMQSPRGKANISGRRRISKWTQYIPFVYLFDKTSVTEVMQCRKNGADFGRFSRCRSGWLESRYIIFSQETNRTLQAYPLCRGDFEYITIYLEQKQIALIEHYLTTVNQKDRYKIYLMENFAQLGDILSLFTLYYDNKNHARRYHMSSGISVKKSWSFSRYKDKYDPAWREKHFPDENFFGRTSLFRE